ncbi:hypothetical protein [Streptomyces sp. NPDC060194]|uniref:hypothetical protein n=1 Tax=Streptomyces sp. NPDC060194 TaxID=3347069 RepID=UPI00364CC564
MPPEEATRPAGDGPRTGPRHAAPRRSLLHRLHRPAGKVMALAAMPTAVIVGTVLVPEPALADDADVPFSAGPCVTREDAAEEEARREAAEKREEAAAERAAKEAAGASEQPPAEPGEGSATPAPDASTRPGHPEPSATQGVQDAREPEPEESRHPLDPLGVGPALKDLFDGPDDEESRPPEPSPSAPGPSAQAEDSPAEAGGSGGRPDDPVKDAVEAAAGLVSSRTEELADDVKDTVRTPKDETGDPADTPTGPDGKPRFPCPEADPEALAAADLEPGVPPLPDEPWKLESSLLTLRGLDYHGIVEVRTSTGRVKKVLKFTAEETDIKDLHQLTVGPGGGGRTGHVTARAGSTSTIRGGTVTMYTEELKGNLFGIVPVTFSPATPPPLNVPFAFFTDAKVTQAAQFGGTLKVPGLRNSFTG